MLPQNYYSLVLKHKLTIVNEPLISNYNGFDAGQQNSKYNKNIPFTLIRIYCHALMEDILEF